MIKGGYYIKARQIRESQIARCAPAVREIWDWLIMTANHADTPVCKRGELFTSYNEISDGLSWYAGWRKMTYSKGDIEHAMKILRKGSMITTQKTTRGIRITLVKYDYFQNSNNYIRQGIPQGVPQQQDTIHKNDKNDKNVEREAEASPTPKDNSRFFFKGIRDFQKKESTVEATSMAELLKKMSLDQGLESPQRKKAFWDEVVKFGDYWQEKDQLGKKERWQMQRTFEVEKRLQTWLKKAGQWSKPASYINKNTPNFVL